MTRAIFWLAAAVAVLGAMLTGARGGLVWLVALLAALIMVRRSWPKKQPTKTEKTEEDEGSGSDQHGGMT